MKSLLVIVAFLAAACAAPEKLTKLPDGSHRSPINRSRSSPEAAP